MRKGLIPAVLLFAVGALLLVSCRRADIRTMTIDVPGMTSARSVRIATNAALAEVIGEYDGIRNDCEVDMGKGVVLYHEGAHLASEDYLRHMQSRIEDVGYQVRFVRVYHNPPPLVVTQDGPIQTWPDRVTVVLKISGMGTKTDANIVVDALSYARQGGDHPNVIVDPVKKEIVATYDSMRLSRKNVEHALACAGFDANNTAARFGAEDSIPHGWTPVAL